MDKQGGEDVRFDSKWQKEWAKGKAHEPEPGKTEKKFITAAFPYPNSPQHIGHGRTYTVADVYARYLKMKGNNVLFPMGFHVTGTPILSMAKKIRERDPDLLDIFARIYGIDAKQAAKLSEPKELVLYFSREIELGMKEMGFSIDWRRKFYSFDPHFTKFIEWQFRKLKELGYLKIGEHPVPWCPADNNAVSSHDTRGDADPEVEEVTMVKFAFMDGSLIVSTYRPETLFGVTNIWVNPDANYVKAAHGKEIFYLAEEAAKNLSLQLKLEIKGKMTGKELVGKKAKSPLGKEVPVFEAKFVKPGEGTGAVMSVPAHAPFDYLALRDLGKVKEVGLPVIIEVKGYSVPAKDAVERIGVKNQEDPRAEEATKEVYKKEVHEGKMKIGNREYDGMKVAEARDKIKAELIAQGRATNMFIIANGPVHCRCGATIVVNKVKNQWFIDYGDLKWKIKTKECLAQMNILPERAREDYIYTIDWLKEKACVRAQGLGTPFPFEKSQIIESLSDSTIYMAFYTIAHLLKEIPAEEMDEKFFDFVFYGKGKGSAIAKKMRESFLYWYPLDSRHSGADLVRNHLPFMMFNHVALFPKGQWPKQIITNGFVLMDGKKMSKSLGNILPLRNAISEYGADVVRLSIVGGADLSADSDFSRTVAQGVEARLRSIFSLVKFADKAAKEKIDFWLLSRLNSRLENIDSKFQKFEHRELVKELFYDTNADLGWYLKRTNRPKLKEFFNLWARAIAPFAPHTAEEIWSRIGGNGFVVNAEMPQGEKKFANSELEMREELVARIIEDVEKISKLVGMKPKKIRLFVADGWKYNAYGIAKEEKNFEKAMKRCMGDAGIKSKGADVPKFIKQIGKNIFALPEVLGAEGEMEALSDSLKFMESQLDSKVEVVAESKGGHEKAKNAMPGKPAIVLE